MNQDRLPYEPWPIEWAVAAQTMGNDPSSGDQYVVQPFVNGVLLAVVDGLGHGEKAAAVAEMAIHILKSYAYQPIDSLFRRCHEKLVGTRGVVMSLAALDLKDETITWLGVGNVEGLLLRANSFAERARESLLLRGGIVGYRLPNLRPATLPLARGDVLVMATDGIRSGFTQALDSSVLPQQLADDLLARYRRGTDDALVLVSRYTGKVEA